MYEPFTADIVHLDGIAVLHLTGELDLAQVEFAQRAAARALTLGRGGPLILGLENLRFFDSSGISALIAIQNAASQQDRSLILRGLRPGLRRVLDIVGLGAHFTIEDVRKTQPNS